MPEIVSGVQTSTALQILQTIKQSQQLKQKLMNQQSIFLQVQLMIATKERVLNQHSRYIKTSMMFLMA